MSIWIRALCSRTVSDLDPTSLLDAARARLDRVAAYYGEDVDDAARAALRLETSTNDGAWHLHYRPGSEAFVRIERWSEAERLAEEKAELEEAIEGWDEDEPGVDRVREALSSMVESVGLELEAPDTEGLGWPVCVAVALVIAERGGGLVQADGEGFLAPSPSGVEHVLDSD